MLDFEADVFKIALKDITAYVSPEVANVGEIIYGMPKISMKDFVWPA